MALNECLQLNSNNNAGSTADSTGNNIKIGACYNNLGQCVDCNKVVNNELSAGYYWFTDENGNRIDSGYLIVARDTGTGGIGTHVNKYKIIDLLTEDSPVVKTTKLVLSLVVVILVVYLGYRLYKA